MTRKSKHRTMAATPSALFDYGTDGLLIVPALDAPVAGRGLVLGYSVSPHFFRHPDAAGMEIHEPQYSLHYIARCDDASMELLKAESELEDGSDTAIHVIVI